MRLLPLLLLPFLTLATTTTAAGPPRGDLSKLQGAWTLVSVEQDGRRLSGRDLQGARLFIEGTSWRAEGADPGTGVLEVTQQARPKHLDLMRTGSDGVAGRTAPAIYKLKGNLLTICRQPRSEGPYERPDRFSSEPGSGTAVFTWKRDPS